MGFRIDSEVELVKNIFSWYIGKSLVALVLKCTALIFRKKIRKNKNQVFTDRKLLTPGTDSAKPNIHKDERTGPDVSMDPMSKNGSLSEMRNLK